MCFHSQHVLTYIYVDNYRKQKVHVATFMELIKWVRPTRVVPYHVAFIILFRKGFKMIISLHENKYKVGLYLFKRNFS